MDINRSWFECSCSHPPAYLEVFTDKQNILWLATDKGVSYVEPSKQLFESWRIPSASENNASENLGYMYSIFEDENGYLMTNWIYGGLYKFDTGGSFIKIIPNLYPQGSTDLRNRTNQAFCILKICEQENCCRKKFQTHLQT